MKKDRLLINKELIPYKFSILLGAQVYFLSVGYNESYDMFTIGLENSEGETLCEAEPIVYGIPLWNDVQFSGEYPALKIIPVDESEQENTVTKNNFNETVFLTVDNSEEPIEI